MLYAGAGPARAATGALTVIPAAAAMIDATPARDNPLLRRTLTETRIVFSSLVQLNAAGQQIARQRVAVAQIDAVEGRGGGRRGLFHDQERDRQAVADPESGNSDRADRIIESQRLDLGRMKVLARARILHLAAVLVVVFARVFVRLEARLFTLRTGEGPVPVGRGASATPPATPATPPPCAAPPPRRPRLARRSARLFPYQTSQRGRGHTADAPPPTTARMCRLGCWCTRR